MRQKVAKALRKKVYGDFSLREPREYVVDGNGVIRVLGRRALYRYMKKRKGARNARP